MKVLNNIDYTVKNKRKRILVISSEDFSKGSFLQKFSIYYPIHKIKRETNEITLQIYYKNKLHNITLLEISGYQTNSVNIDTNEISSKIKIFK